MSASLVGSEMCIRDRVMLNMAELAEGAKDGPKPPTRCGASGGAMTCIEAVSYTHLTLPTICSV
eukprot:7101470-Alexandrium_andersonii.AAC.1